MKIVTKTDIPPTPTTKHVQANEDHFSDLLF